MRVGGRSVTLAQMFWSCAELVDVIAEGLKRRAAADDAEQAVYGFDQLDELALHPVIQDSLRDEGFGVWPELSCQRHCILQTRRHTAKLRPHPLWRRIVV